MLNLIKVACLRYLKRKAGFQCILLRTTKETNMTSIVRSREEQVFNIFHKENKSTLVLHVTNAEFVVEHNVLEFELMLSSQDADYPFRQTYYIFWGKSTSLMPLTL